MKLLSVLLLMLLAAACSSREGLTGKGVNGAAQGKLTQSQGEADRKSARNSGSGKVISSATLIGMMETIASSADQTVVDGWFYGQDSRLFKSFYRKIPAAGKADFAMAYHDFLVSSGQDMLRDFKSYVPYSKRADFAFSWWREKEPRFAGEELKMQVLWAHESILDAGELWWRAWERLKPGNLDSMQTLAHDEEQRMLAHYMEKEGNPGSLSEQVFKRKQSGAALTGHQEKP